MAGLEPHYLMFLTAAVLLAVTPGPGIAYVLARTVAGGRSEGMASSIGTGVGGLAHVAASAMGLSVLLAESAWAFSIVKYAGACYLVHLGIRVLRKPAVATMPTSGAATGCPRALLEGIVTEMLNVKTALFFLAFIPNSSIPRCRHSVSFCCSGAFAWR